MTSSHHHQLPFFFPNLFQNHPVYKIEAYVGIEVSKSQGCQKTSGFKGH
jgi:hypothetical protein